jgi:acetolactate synthase-1/2/3 large subunit
MASSRAFGTYIVASNGGTSSGTSTGSRETLVNGAQALVRTLVDAGVDTCFMNPGTSEMHFVAALDTAPGMRGVLGLFEGVATGAADGYARIAGRPAAVLLHLGPGLGNGLANLHNARRAHSPVVVIVGDHATYHQHLDAPLQSDIDALAGSVSGWVRRGRSAATLGRDAADAVAAASSAPGQIATLVLPADVSWSDGGRPAPPRRPGAAQPVDDATVKEVADVLRSGGPAVLLLGGAALREPGLRAAARIAAATNARLLTETFPARVQRGGDLPAVDRLAYLAEAASGQLDGATHLVLAGARAPVSFFAYPGRPSDLVPPGCQQHTLAAGDDDTVQALEALAERLDAGPVPPPREPVARPAPPAGPIDAGTFAAAIANALPEQAIVVDESNTSGQGLPAAMTGAPRHDVLALTGGAIGHGLPTALGAAVAAPDRPVLCLQADGSAMYTLQALWTQAREGANVTTVVVNNGSYAILRMELARVGAGTGGPQARDMLDLSRPDLDFAALASGMGVPAVRVSTAEDLLTAVERALAEPGPHLVDAVFSRPG